jgi:hypothetical protein
MPRVAARRVLAATSETAADGFPAAGALAKHEIDRVTADYSQIEVRAAA